MPLHLSRIFKKKKRSSSNPSLTPALIDLAERTLLLAGRSAANAQSCRGKIEDLSDVEFRVFSQWGEDGIVEWLVKMIEVPNHRFIEFGVESFQEANCRFLMFNRNWKGLVLDGSHENILCAQREKTYWMYDITAQSEFVTAENINNVIIEAGFAGPLGVLSIDIDGNDYWIWRGITSVEPAIIICEYNPIFGDVHPVSIPYDPSFTRFKYHHSGLYFGCSIEALRQLAVRRGYTFIGTNSNGINAFFVRDDLAAPVLETISKVRAYPSRHRDSRNQNGELTYVGGIQRLKLISHLEVENVMTGKRMKLGDLDGPYSAEWLAGMS